MKKLLFLCLLSIMILYTHCADDAPSADTDPDTPATPATPDVSTINCEGAKIGTGDGEVSSCDGLKLKDSTKKCAKNKDGTACEEVAKSTNAGNILNIFKISFTLIIIFTIL